VQTRRLLARLPARADYHELDAGHDLASEGSPVRDEVLRMGLAFVQDTAHPLRGEG
jgi:hypothetical protein